MSLRAAAGTFTGAPNGTPTAPTGGVTEGEDVSARPGGDAADPEARGPAEGDAVDLDAAYRASAIDEILDELDNDLVGLGPVKTRIREIAALLLVAKLRERVGLTTDRPTLHMSFTGRPGTGKTTVARRMAAVLHRLGYVRKGHLVAAARDDLVGQYVGHTAPKTREVLKRAAGGVLFVDEAYYLYRPENERDYGPEAIEILLQAMENQRDDLVVILAGYGEQMNTFFQSNPGLRSRVAHHIEFPDFTLDELMTIAEAMVRQQQYALDEAARGALREYLERRVEQPHFANARSVRNAVDRAKLRQANRLVRRGGSLPRAELARIDAADFRASRVFGAGAGAPGGAPAAPTRALPGADA